MRTVQQNFRKSIISDDCVEDFKIKKNYDREMRCKAVDSWGKKMRGWRGGLGLGGV